MNPSGNAEMRCSFCGKDKDQVTYLIAGPAVFICGECVNVCVEIINQARVAGSSGDPAQ